jgi:hypothetical protein
MSDLNLLSCPVKMKEIVFQSMPPDTILLNLDNGYYYSTNRVGAAVWDRCDGNTTIAEMMADISERSGEPAQRVEADILHFVSDMMKEGLVKLEQG